MNLYRCHTLLSKRIDPFRRLLHLPTRPVSSSLGPSDGVGSSSHRAGDAGKHSRESSIRSNRRFKFIDSLTKEDLNICERLAPILNGDAI